MNLAKELTRRLKAFFARDKLEEEVAVVSARIDPAPSCLVKVERRTVTPANPDVEGSQPGVALRTQRVLLPIELARIHEREHLDELSAVLFEELTGRDA